jgi:hypothetical protein
MSDCGLGRVTRRSRYTVAGAESGDALTEVTIAEVKVKRVGKKVGQTNKKGNSTPCVSYARYCHDHSFVVPASLISGSSACFGAGLHSGSFGSYSRVIENDYRSVQRRFGWHFPSRRCSGSSTPSGSLPYLVGRIHLHRLCKHWKSVNCKAIYWQGERATYLIPNWCRQNGIATFREDILWSLALSAANRLRELVELSLHNVV